MITLYGHASRTAANILKLRAALAEAGLEYTYVSLDLANGEQHKAEYLALNPHGKVPTLADGDFVLPESDAILWYIAERAPEAGLLPKDLQGRARVMQWCDFASTGLYPQSYDLYIHTTYAEPANRSTFVAERARTALDRACKVLEQRLTGRTYVAVDSFTIADLGVASVIHMLSTREQIALAAHPHIDAHYRRITQRPAWQKALLDNP